MIRRPPRSTRTDTLFPYTTLFRSDLADLATPEAFLFIAFRVPYSPAIGVKLISTPWTDQNLEHAEGIGAEQLRKEHRNKGMPDDLANILEQIGRASCRERVCQYV